MLQPGPRQEPPGSPPPDSAVQSGPAPGDQQPIRFLLIRQKAGDLPWLVRALTDYMAPAQIVPVIGMGNALWRLGHERFDAVLLDVNVADPAVLERCREQSADVAAVPVRSLHDRPAPASSASIPGASARPPGPPRRSTGTRWGVCPGSAARGGRHAGRTRRRRPSPDARGKGSCDRDLPHSLRRARVSDAVLMAPRSGFRRRNRSRLTGRTVRPEARTSRGGGRRGSIADRRRAGRAEAARPRRPRPPAARRRKSSDRRLRS